MDKGERGSRNPKILRTSYKYRPKDFGQGEDGKEWQEISEPPAETHPRRAGGQGRGVCLQRRTVNVGRLSCKTSVEAARQG